MPIGKTGIENELIGKDGSGSYTSKHVHINYNPIGASDIPAISVGYFPGDVTESPTMRVTSGSNNTGDSVTIERIEEGNFIRMIFDGDDKVVIQDIGGVTANAFVSGGSILGSIATLTDGNIDAENTLLAISSITADTEYTATSHRDGQLLFLYVKNTDTNQHTLTFGSGFSAESVTVDASSWKLLCFIHGDSSNDYFYKLSSGDGGSLPSGSEGNILIYHDGEWVASSQISVTEDSGQWDINISGDDVVIEANDFQVLYDMRILYGGLTLDVGDLVLSSGDVEVSNGGITVTSGDVDIDSGNIGIVNGNLDITGGSIRLDDNYYLNFGDDTGPSGFGIRSSSGRIEYKHSGEDWSEIGSGGTPGGSDKYVQFNDGGSFGGDSTFQFDKTTKVLSVNDLLVASGEYINFGAVSGSPGYGLRDNSGTIQFKNSGGSWSDLGGSEHDFNYYNGRR